MSAEDDRQARLAAALRANLRRRKTAGQSPPPADPPKPGAVPPERPDDG